MHGHAAKQMVMGKYDRQIKSLHLLLVPSIPFLYRVQLFWRGSARQVLPKLKPWFYQGCQTGNLGDPLQWPDRFLNWNDFLCAEWTAIESGWCIRNVCGPKNDIVPRLKRSDKFLGTGKKESVSLWIFVRQERRWTNEYVEWLFLEKRHELDNCTED